MKVTADKIAVEPYSETTTTIGGIVIPENAHRAIRSGRVKCVGPSEDKEISIGDKVYYQAAAAVELEVDGVTLAILDVHNVLAIEEWTRAKGKKWSDGQPTP
jgi:co-chaperonin GroES (HSP10)